MDVQFLEENRRKKFAILPYREYRRLVELAADQGDYEKALKILENAKDRILDYDSSRILESPIAAKREGLQISQRELARRMQVDPSWISRLERPGANPSQETLRKVAKALDCPVEELI